MEREMGFYWLKNTQAATGTPGGVPLAVFRS
jgi:hypothetical protein